MTLQLNHSQVWTCQTCFSVFFDDNLLVSYLLVSFYIIFFHLETLVLKSKFDIQYKIQPFCYQIYVCLIFFIFLIQCFISFSVLTFLSHSFFFCLSLSFFILQEWQKISILLLHKPYQNRATLSQDYIP